jgi:GNAT superfamily N-acetyltransferase
VADAPAIAELYTSLSRRSIQMRFSSFMTAEALQRAAHLDPHNGALALIALVNGRVIAEARYELTADGVYEFGIAVADDHQQRGLGRRLLDRLREDALERGISSLRAVVQIDNLPMLHMLHQIGYAIVMSADGGQVSVDIACDEGMPGWSGSTRGRRVLIESRGLWEDAQTTALRVAGFEVRRCPGPSHGPRSCPLLSLGRCRLVEESDFVACLLPESDPDCRAVADKHAVHRPDRLVARSTREWRNTAPELIRS